MSEHWIDEIVNYLRERFPLRLFLPLAAGLTAAALAGTRGLPEILLCWVTVVFVLFQFRLWDDLADLVYDRVHHPQRVLSRSATPDHYIHIVGAAGLVNASFLALLNRSHVGFVALNLAALVWYGCTTIEARRSVIGRHVTLLKYPFFVLLIAPTSIAGLKPIFPASAVYLCLAIYEVLHDREVRGQPAARILMWMEVSLLGLNIALLSR
jgi:4-hydroxybenzoate polyprenyltransferase